MDKNKRGKPQFSEKRVKVPLGSLGKVVTGNTPSKKNERYWATEDVPFIKPGDIDESAVTYLADGTEYIADCAIGKARCVGAGAVLVTCIGTIAKIAVVNCNCIAFNQQINAIDVDRNVVDPQYLAYALKANNTRLKMLANAPVVPIINKRQFESFVLLIHSDLNVQREIVSQFTAIGSLRQKLDEELCHLDNLVKSRFIEMFGDPSSKQCEAFIEDAFFIRDDLRKPLSSKERDAMKTGELYPYYGANGKVDDINQFLTDCDALCFAEDCGSYGPGEPTAYVIRGKAWVNNHAHLLIAKCPHFLEYARTYFTLLDINRFISGTTRAKMTQAQLKKVNIEVPDQAMLREFDGFVSNVDKLRFKTQQQIEKLEMLKESLMQEYFG